MKPALAILTALIAFNSYASGGDKGLILSNPLPTTAPAADVLLRESFGSGPDNARPNGKGTMKAVYASTTLGGFWGEYPGSKNLTWLSTDPASGGATWRFAGCSVDVNETLPTPLQVGDMNGCVVSSWFEPVVVFPTALLPFTPPATPYEVSADLYPAVLDGASVSLGLTSSSVQANNLNTVGQLYLTFRQALPLQGYTGEYELRAGGANGPVLATGSTWLMGFANSFVLRVDPLAQTVSARVNGTLLGTFPMSVAPQYVAIEGQGIVDNLVVRLAP